MQRLQVAAVGLARSEWARMSTDFDASWRTVGPRLVLLTGSAQLGAARSGAAYVPDALAQQGVQTSAEGQVDPSALAGVASDGRDLAGLLYGAVTTAKAAVAQQQAPRPALQAGGRALDMYVQTMITDAGRQAASVAIAARPPVGWVRMVNPPCCGRCAVLAGRFYRWSQGFQRHPRCDCTHIPTIEDVAGDVRTDVGALFSSGQVHDLSNGEAAAIRDGADPAAIINATRAGSGMTTTEATRRARVAGARLTPDGIYARAASRREALQLLVDHGYLQP